MMARVYEFWTNRGVKLVVPSKIQNIEKLQASFGYLPNLEFIGIANDPIVEEEEVHRISKELQLRVLNSGHKRFLMLQKIFPFMGLNQLLALGAFVYLTDFYSYQFRKYYFRSKVDFRITPKYIFIDRKVGTEREIAIGVVKAILKENLVIVENEMKIPFHQLGCYMEMANELHLVGSAPLCLSLVLGTNTKLNVHYVLHESEHMKGDSPNNRWKTFNVSTGKFIEISQKKTLIQTLLLVRLLNKLNWNQK
jgi:hypothetical protein